MNQFKLLLRYFQYLLKSQSKKKIRSPFIVQFIQEVLEDERHFYTYHDVEKLRLKLLQDERVIEITDFGAGSKTISNSQIAVGNKRKRKIKDIAKHSAKSAKYAQLLFRIVNHFQPKNILELGTSLGISTLYQSLPVKDSKFVTLEGCPQIANIARENFSQFNLKNIELMGGNFDNTLADAVKSFSTLDYVFFDGNHQKIPTINYFEQCIPLAHNDTIFIFDDIHWSDEMEEAWKIIQQHPKVTSTIDLFFIGIVFFRKELSKENFTLTF